ncbi:MAG: Fe-S cluster assembly protein SufD [Bacteroidales bacterium]|nr:Fe-S cluster assembly protein SufD [Bacteroidales bacterium]
MEKRAVLPELQEKILKLYNSNKETIVANDTPRVSALREVALKSFEEQGFPTSALENWRNTRLEKALDYDFNIVFEPQVDSSEFDKVFKCDIHGFDANMYAHLNGWHLRKETKLTRHDNGVIIGSLALAMQEEPELVDQHIGNYLNLEKNGLTALNAAMAQDGVFIYIPDNIEVEKAIQLVNVTSRPDHAFEQLRNLIIIGKNAKATILQCDDSYNHEASFSNCVTEVFLDQGAKLDHYKLQNLNDASTLINTMYFHQEKDSSLMTNAITLNGGIMRNDSFVKLNGRGAHADILGLYLMDREQHVDNQVYVDHAVSDCTSNQLFKGIVDDNARAVFNGYVLVRRDAQRTLAFQNNRNIALTDKATINTKPFLEIYADDVKCSHGATVGQLDDTALFYIKSRGISEYNARLLLMYAFAAEVINFINIEALRIRIDDLVKKRLRGELSVCDQCVLHCSSQEKTVSFEIDMSKI